MGVLMYIDALRNHDTELFERLQGPKEMSAKGLPVLLEMDAVREIVQLASTGLDFAVVYGLL